MNTLKRFILIEASLQQLDNYTGSIKDFSTDGEIYNRMPQVIHHITKQTLFYQ